MLIFMTRRSAGLNIFQLSSALEGKSKMLDQNKMLPLHASGFVVSKLSFVIKPYQLFVCDVKKKKMYTAQNVYIHTQHPDRCILSSLPFRLLTYFIVFRFVGVFFKGKSLFYLRKMWIPAVFIAVGGILFLSLFYNYSIYGFHFKTAETHNINVWHDGVFI